MVKDKRIRLIIKGAEMNIIPRIVLKQKTLVLIVGAGEAGRLVHDEIIKHPALNYQVIGFVDDDPKKQKKSINGILVLGKVKDIPQVVKAKNIEEIIVAIPSASGWQNRRIINKCLESKIHFRIIPGIYEILKKDTDVGSLRDVELEDLIKRKPINFDLDNIQSYLSGKTVLISGAAGSIGTELYRQIIRFNPSKVILFDHEENALNDIFTEERENYAPASVIPVVGDIRDKERLKFVFARFKPDVVFHSAAYKHVPLMEINLSECIKNNVFGTLNIIEVTKRYNAKNLYLFPRIKPSTPLV